MTAVYMHLLQKKIFFFHIFHIFATTNICHLQSRTYQKPIFTCTILALQTIIYTYVLTCVHIYVYIWLFSKSCLLDIYKDSLLLQINYALQYIFSGVGGYKVDLDLLIQFKIIWERKKERKISFLINFSLKIIENTMQLSKDIKGD